MSKDYKICIIGLGYVGLPLAVLFSKRYPTIGFDIDRQRVEEIENGDDSTKELSEEKLQAALCNNLYCTSDENEICDANIYIVTVPTPVNSDNTPDTAPLINASELIGRVISRGDIVIYESTVYPGMTEEVCIPEIETVSGLKFNEDFYAGYSPERVNPGDKEHTIENIKKVTSGSTPEIAETVDALYNSVLSAGTHLAPSIRVAEASKIIENSQRDVNIAFMNELAKLFNVMGIDTHDVIEAASTKWNFIKMAPGLVGGHCISIDPYYLIEKAKVYGIMPHIIQASRRLNESMGRYVASQVIKHMNLKGIRIKDASILIMGITFKENCPDIRNTKIVDIYDTLSEYTSDITILDPVADTEKVWNELKLRIVERVADGKKYDAIIYAVSHKAFECIDLRNLQKENGLIYDVKGCVEKSLSPIRL